MKILDLFMARVFSSLLEGINLKLAANRNYLINTFDWDNLIGNLAVKNIDICD